MEEILGRIHGLVWGIPTLLLIILVSILLGVKTGFCQVTLFPAALRRFGASIREDKGQAHPSGYSALCTALAATVGTGNIAGVAGAICLGGPGAVFWMWICGLLGMGIKYAEATLAVFFRRKGDDGQWYGGPMYMIREGLGKKWSPLASVYCLLGLVASFGIGNATQINALMSGMSSAFGAIGLPLHRSAKIFAAIILAVTVYVMLRGGAKWIGAAAQQLVPAASIVYTIMCILVIGANFTAVDDAFKAIICGAFHTRAVTGGMVGSVFTALRIGLSRGIFTNEAGMGTASIAHAGADVDHPVEQGLMGIVEVFLDTIVICTLTALTILTSGVPIPFGYDPGAQLTGEAFSSALGDFGIFLMFATMCCFAFATILGWGLYGIRCAEFLFGYKATIIFPLCQGIVVIFAVFTETSTLWIVCDILNGLMTIPNLTALLLLMDPLLRLTKEYKHMKKTDS